MPKTLYIRNVPDDVAERLAEMAAREGLSVSALAARELAFAARQGDNAALLAALPSHDHISPETILQTIKENRGER